MTRRSSIQRINPIIDPVANDPAGSPPSKMSNGRHPTDFKVPQRHHMAPIRVPGTADALCRSSRDLCQIESSADDFLECSGRVYCFCWVPGD
jgi:hypothetical protein